MGRTQPTLSFGIITDTHVRSPEGDQSSPYPVNDKANARANYACKLLAAQDPAFVVHLGDMVHPLPAMTSYYPACEEAIRLFEPLKGNLHYVAGNHDVGDKPMPGSPAAIVSREAMNRYSSWFGKHWYSFDVGNLRIIVINSSLINTGSQAENEQNLWLDEILANSRDHRVILFSHYPLFIHDPLETEHYDNIAEPGRQALLTKIETHTVDIVFSGHVHHFFYNQVGHSKFFTLPSTSFTRQDYADLFKSEPAAEFGRNDAAKLAITMVDVYPDNYQIRIIDTQGIENDNNNLELIQGMAHTPSEKNITLHMRHPLHETIELPYNGPMEEFTRKRARNDYPLLRLMQMGIYQLRIPIHDLMGEASRKRIEEISGLGFRFTLVCLQSSWLQLQKSITGMNPAIEAIEYILPNDKSHWKAPDPLRENTTPIYLGFASSGAHNSNPLKPFAHTVNSGFQLNQLSEAVNWLEQQDKHTNLKGIIIQIAWESSLEKSITEIKGALASYSGTVIINLRISKSNPAEENVNEQAIGDRICLAMELTESIDRAELQIDTFMSLDRGYSPRTGLVDRLGNLTQVGRRMASL